MRRRKVVLPAPLGPVISTSSPRAIVKLTSENTERRQNFLETLEIRTAGLGPPFPLGACGLAALPLGAVFSAAATLSRFVVRTPLETGPRCPTLSHAQISPSRGFQPRDIL
jgi:hypothetical protein